MGWTTTDKPFNVKKYIDDMHVHNDRDTKQVVLKSVIKKFKQYYAAVKRTNLVTGEERVWASVVMLDYDHDSHGNTDLMYKELGEGYNPVYRECPKSILSLLTPTTDNHALDWRTACWENIGSAELLKKQLVHGNKVKFKNPIRFTNKAVYDEMYVWKHKNMVRFSPYPVLPKTDTFNQWSGRPSYQISKSSLLGNIVQK